MNERFVPAAVAVLRPNDDATIEQWKERHAHLCLQIGDYGRAACLRWRP